MTATRLLLVLAMLSLGGAWPVAAATRGKPNIVFILADDLGRQDLGCYGSTYYETPALDALAAGGVKFTQAYAACCVCSPTRASILTGKYPQRMGITDWLPGRKDSPSQKLRRPVLPDHLPHEEVTIATALKEAGYATAFLGKWHLGGAGHYPDAYGFDVNIGGCERGAPNSYFSPYKLPTITDGPVGEYLTDRLTEEACKYIAANKDRPFLLYLSHYAVHNPQQAKAEDVKHFKDKAAALPTGARPEFIPEHNSKARQVQNQPVYAANIKCMDDSVGRITAKLKELGLDGDTIVIFTSDNGGLSTSEGYPTSNLPLRAGKGWNYEGGIREPLIVRWPGVAGPGKECDGPTISTDFYPTMLEMAGAAPRPAQHVDGVSIVPLLKGEKLKERPFFWHYPHYSNQGVTPSAAVRAGDYKLIEWFEDDHVELYNLAQDVGEHDDLTAKEPKSAEELRQQLHAWQKSVGALMPTPNPEYKAPKRVAPPGK